MAKGYWVVFADVTDPEGYKSYVAAAFKALAKYGVGASSLAAAMSKRRKAGQGRAS